MIAGVCKYCGCTASRPCLVPVDGELAALPCAWLNPEQTLCTACIEKATIEELWPAFTAEIAEVADLAFPLFLPVVDAFKLVAVLQLALRHPEFEKQSPSVHEFTTAMVAGLREHFADLLAIQEVCRRGELAAFDQPAEARIASKLILPT
jgi:hypothetical protein